MRIALMVITDGRREYLERTLASFDAMVTGPIVDRLMINDCLDVSERMYLDTNYPQYRRVHHDAKAGFCGAIQSGWDNLSPDVDMVAHWESDFTLNRPVDLVVMADVLEANPHLVQLVLKRQAWGEAETAAGGVVEQWPDQYTEHITEQGNAWLEHRLFFSTNPSLYRRSLTESGWPGPPACEAEFTQRILEDPRARFAFWGRRLDPPWVTHIGVDRAGHGY